MLPAAPLPAGIFHDMNYFLSIVGVKLTLQDSSSRKKSNRVDTKIVALGESHLAVLHSVSSMQCDAGESSYMVFRNVFTT